MFGRRRKVPKNYVPSRGSQYLSESLSENEDISEPKCQLLLPSTSIAVPTTSSQSKSNYSATGANPKAFPKQGLCQANHSKDNSNAVDPNQQLENVILKKLPFYD